MHVEGSNMAQRSAGVQEIFSAQMMQRKVDNHRWKHRTKKSSPPRIQQAHTCSYDNCILAYFHDHNATSLKQEASPHP